MNLERAAVGFNGDLMAQSFQSLDQPPRGTEDVAPVEVVSPEFLIYRSSRLHVAADREHRIGNGDDGPLGTPQCSQTAELSLQVGVLGFRGHLCAPEQK